MHPRKQLWPVESELQAYCLGALAAGLERVEPTAIVVKRPRRRLLKLLAKLGPLTLVATDEGLRIESSDSVQSLREAGLLPDSCTLLLPALDTRLRAAFVRGAFEVAGKLARPRARAGKLEVTLRLERALAHGIAECYPGARLHELPRQKLLIEWRSVNALDFLGHLYEGALIHRKSYWQRYRDWAGSLPVREARASALYELMDAAAVAPHKAQVSDAGYDLTLIRVVKRFGPVTLFGTGLRVSPPPGWYFDVVPRSSIIKSGYISANSVGVIDPSYRGEIMVPLIKLDTHAPDLVLPARIAQMIPRPIVHLGFEGRESLDATLRGAGGFGSTGA